MKKFIRYYIFLVLILLLCIWIDNKVKPITLIKEVIKEKKVEVTKEIKTPTDINIFSIQEVIDEETKNKLVNGYQENQRLFKVRVSNYIMAAATDNKTNTTYILLK